MKKAIVIATGIALLAACKTEQKTESKQPKETTNMEVKKESLKETALKAQDAFFKEYSVDGIKKYFTEDYIQHNPHVPTGREPFLGFLEPLKNSGTTATTHRILQDGDFIVLHNSYDNA